MNILLIILFLIYFVYTFVKIYNKTYIFGLVYFIIFLYTFFTMLGYNLYPDDLYVVSSGQYYGEDIFLNYYAYICLCFITMYISFFIIYGTEFFVPSIKVLLLDNRRFRIINEIIFFSFNIIIIFILLFFLIKYYNQLSYYNQSVLKSNKIWFYLFSASGIFIFAIITKIFTIKNKFNKYIYEAILIFLTLVVIITALKAGQRIQLFKITLSFIIYISIKYDLKIKLRNTFKVSKLVIPAMVFVVFSQLIRSSRGNVISISDGILNIESLKELFDFKTLIFQDYLVPSLTLITSMNYKIIFPIEVIKSNFINATIIGDYPTLGAILARIIDPSGWGGYGYYILTEGYNLMGFMGFIYISVIIVIVYRLYEKVLTKTNDKNFNLYMSCIISYYIIDIVRSGSLFMIKGVFFYIIPFIFLYCKATNKKIRIYI